MTPFTPGATIQRREVLHGDLWLTHPVSVVADDGEVLAVRLDPGSPFTFPEHPFGPHPWSANDAWAHTVILMLSREHTRYGAWKVFGADGGFRHWYFNFEPPIVRLEGGYETDDHGLDLIVHPDGRREWKDVEDLHHQRTQGRIDDRQVLDVLDAAAELIDLLDTDQRWWSAWDDWTPLARPQRSG